MTSFSVSSKMMRDGSIPAVSSWFITNGANSGPMSEVPEILIERIEPGFAARDSTARPMTKRSSSAPWPER